MLSFDPQMSKTEGVSHSKDLCILDLAAWKNRGSKLRFIAIASYISSQQTVNSNLITTDLLQFSNKKLLELLDHNDDDYELFTVIFNVCSGTQRGKTSSRLLKSWSLTKSSLRRWWWPWHLRFLFQRHPDSESSDYDWAGAMQYKQEPGGIIPLRTFCSHFPI